MLSEMRLSGRLLLALVLAGAAGCSKTEPANNRVTIVPTLATKVTALDFERGDCIGLTIVRAAGIYADNVPMTYDGAAFSDGPAWYADRQEASTLTAYYPYCSQGRPSEFSVAADQRAGCASSDLLGAVSGDVLPSAGPVKMLFNHLLSQLTVVVNNRSGAAVSGVTLGGFSPTAQIDFETLEVAVVATAGIGEVQACEEEAGVSYRAILVPQSADLTAAVAMADGRVYRKTVPQATLESGKSYALTVDVADDGLTVALSGEIRNWVDGGAIDAMVGGGNTTGGGTGETGGDDDDGFLNDGGERYRTVTIGAKVWMAENLRCMPPQAALGSGVWHPKEGAAAVAGKGLLYDRAAALGSDMYAAASRVRGICPAGWHIPDKEELQTLVGADCGAGFFVDSGCWIVVAATEPKYGTYSYLMSAALSDADGQMECLRVGSASGAGSMFPLPVAYGVSVRCVKD